MTRKRGLVVLIVLGVLFFAPGIAVRLTQSMLLPQDAQPADAALIFGAVVRNSQISPLHKERLDAGIALLNAQTVERLVVSNRAKAAQAMRDYLLENDIDPQRIEVDTTAEHTPDTCEFEVAKPEVRSVIFVSQKFHLPRIALQCRLVGLRGQLVMADDPNRATPNLGTLIRVRGQRLIREAFLSWGALLGTYPE